MFFAHILSILAMVVGTFQKVAGQVRCQGTQEYNEKENNCCFRCPQGYVSRSSCVKDIKKECVTCPEPNNFIRWSQNPPCTPCRICKKESFLVEIQSCSLLTEAICQCKPGYYCHTTLHNTCARCNPLTPCPCGQGVKRKGSANKDTECEVCPSGTFSNVTSATEACKPHTDCNKLHRLTILRGNAMADAQCGDPKGPDLMPSGNNTLTYTRDTATSTTNTRHTSTLHTSTLHIITRRTSTSGTITGTTTKHGAEESGKWSSVYVVVAAIICVILLLLAFLLSWKQKICSLRLWKNFIQPGHPERTVTTNTEENSEENLLLRKNITPETETNQRSERTERDRTMEDRQETQQRPDQMNNRIEKIYIVNADTVVVGSIAEVSTHGRSVTSDCGSRESPPLVSRYPEQESSKLSANDLMISIEEEERGSCSAKAILEV